MPAEAASRRQVALFAVLTYDEHAPRVKMAAALPVEWRVLARLGWVGQTTDFFEHSLPLTMRGSSEACIGCWSEIFNRPIPYACHCSDFAFGCSGGNGGQVLTSYIHFLLVYPMTWDQSLCGNVEPVSGRPATAGSGEKKIFRAPIKNVLFRDGGVSRVFTAFGAHKHAALRTVRPHVFAHTLRFSVRGFLARTKFAWFLEAPLSQDLPSYPLLYSIRLGPLVITDSRKFVPMGIWGSLARVFLIILSVEFRFLILSPTFLKEV